MEWTEDPPFFGLIFGYFQVYTVIKKKYLMYTVTFRGWDLGEL